jgi:hypothetical protein
LNLVKKKKKESKINANEIDDDGIEKEKGIFEM